MKTEEEIRNELKIRNKLKRVKSDERLNYKTATVYENALLAFIQLELEARVATLRWVLDNKED